MSTVTSAAKRCVNCNRDVTNDKRMKDSSGKYWCVKCGEADRAKKGQGAAPLVACPKCNDKYPAAKLQRFGKEKVCPACYNEGTRGGGVSMAGGDGARTMKLVVAMGVLAVVYVVGHFGIHMF